MYIARDRVYCVVLLCTEKKKNRGIRIRLDYGRKDTFISLLKKINSLFDNEMTHVKPSQIYK